jgi:iron(III) transport system permease protein
MLKPLRVFILIAIVGLIAAPSIFVLALALASYKSSASWSNVVFATVQSTAFDTIFLASCAGISSSLCGLAFAKIFERYHFPLRKFLSFGILSLLLFPPFVLSGIIERTWFLNTINPKVTFVVVQSLASLPMCFLILRAALQRIPRAYAEVATTLGLNRIQRTLHLHIGMLTLPLFASFLVAAAAATTDIESAERLGVRSFSLSVNELWMGAQRNDVAAWLASIIVITAAVFLAPIILYISRKSLRNFSQLESIKQHKRNCSTAQKISITVFCATFVSIFAGTPIVFTFVWALEKINRVNLSSLAADFANAITASTTTVALSFACAISAIIVLRSTKNSKWFDRLLWLSLLNYFLPATVLALSFFVATGTTSVFASFTFWARETFLGISVATTFRFIPLLLLPLIDSLDRTSPSLPECARTLGLTHSSAMTKIVFPISKPAISAGLSLIFIECMKDITLTQALAPFGHSTLAMRISSYSKLHMDQEAAVWVVVLVALLVYPLTKIQSYIDAERN